MSDLAAIIVLLAGLGAGFDLHAHSVASAPPARHFPGLPAKPPRTPTYSPLVWQVAAVISGVAVLLLMIANPSPRAALVLAVCAAVLLVAISWPFHLYARACARTNTAIEAYAARIAMPYTGTELVHVGMWAPYIRRSGVTWCVVTRTAGHLDELAATYDIPILAGDLPRSVKAALYPHQSAENADFLATAGVTHVFLGSGDSDKPLSAPENLLGYDIIAVAGQAAIDRFEKSGLMIPRERIRIVGRPQTEGIVRASGPMSSIESPTVLFAPTWPDADDSVNSSSLVVGDTIVKALLDRGVTVVFRRHFARHDQDEAMIRTIHDLLEQDAAATGLRHVWGDAASAELPLVDAFNLSDALISDVPGIVVDYMQSEKPVAMYAAQVGTGPDLATEFRAEHPTAESAYVIDKDAINLETILTLMLGPDPLSPSRMRQSAYYLGGEDRPERAGPFIAFVKELGS